MKILQIVDVPFWAIGKLSTIIRKHNPHLNFRVLYVHPKEVTAEKIKEVRDNLAWADIVDLQYWNTARQLLEQIPELREKKLMLTHHNQKDLLAFDWKDINLHIVHTRRAEEILRADGGYENVMQIPYGFDLSFFTYLEDYKPETKYIGYCGRVVPWKGLKEIARAAYELGYKILAMGKIDKPNYWAEISEEHRNNINFEYMDVDDDQRLEFYHQLAIYVGNSGPNHEEGTMPLQEAMASGIPVLTTPAGVADDIIEDGINGVITPFDNYEALKANIKHLMENFELRQELRKNAWQTIKLHTEERMAWEFERAYHKLFSDEPLVSVIIPTTLDRVNETDQILKALQQSDYKHIEVIVALDQTKVVNKSTLEGQGEFNFPIKFVCTDTIGGYNLAKGRNLAAVEAQGEYLMFCDSRLEPFADAITSFIVEMRKADKKDRWWLFGEKGGKKQNFVENFSFVRRDFFIRAGMMNERINNYGGMSQELRARFQWQGFLLKYVPQACAKQLTGSKLTGKRRQDIIKSKLLLWKMGMKG